MQKNEHNTYNTLFYWHNFRLRLVFEGVIVGLLTGLVIVLYRYLIEKAGEITNMIYQAQLRNHFLIPLWLIALVLIGYVIGTIVKKEPMVSGSGIPQVEGVLLRRLSMNWWRVIIGKFVGGVLAIGAGLSLGREGPSVQIGAAVGQGFCRVFKRIKLEEKFLITSGASAGLAAAFNAPLAGVIFSLEEIHKNFSPVVLTCVMAASLTADFVSKEFFGLKPVFDFSNIHPLPLDKYIYIIALGIVVGAFGVLFSKILLKTQNLYARQIWLPVQLRPVIPLLLAGVLGLTLPQVLGGGHGLIMSLVTGNFGLLVLIVLLFMKFAFTMVSYGSGAPGGIFLPLLVIGAVTGDIYGSLLVNIFHFDAGYISNFIILAMAGYFTAIVKAPITGTILITEMTGSFNHLLALTIVSITAYVVSDFLGSKPIYESMLERIIGNKSIEGFKGDDKTKVLIESAVSMGSEAEGKLVKNLKWPEHCLLVGLKRGAREIIPRGGTTIYAGDYLIILANEDNAAEVREQISEMTEKCRFE